jgi:hypothetical protein
VFTQDSRSERRASGEIVIATREDGYNHVKSGKYEYTLLPVTDRGARFD